jgi:hypothetical protein
MDVLRDEWEVVAWMLAGLVSFKAAVNIALGPLFGLTRCGRPPRARACARQLPAAGLCGLSCCGARRGLVRDALRVRICTPRHGAFAVTATSGFP